MKKYHNIEKYLTTTELKAIDMLVTKISKLWPGAKFKLFGSKVTGNFDEESDIDILILLPCKVTRKIEEQIIDMVFYINLQLGTNISPLIFSEEEWNNSPISVLPIHYFVEKEGVSL
jgi:predicted nucleotidyltransferase